VLTLLWGGPKERLRERVAARWRCSRGGDAVELGEGLCELGGAVWGGEEARGLFIGGLRRFGGKIFPAGGRR
jgi:hypothetical protein